jgi:hypothetical protein
VVLPTFLRAIEATGLSVWLRESPSLLAYPAILTAHTLGLALVTAPNVAIDLRILGAAPRLPLAPLERFFGIMWLGFWVNTISGVVLLIAYPTKALTDPIFYLKLGFIAAAMVSMQLIRNRVFRRVNPAQGPLAANAKNLAAMSLFFWFGAIAAGKFIEYTYTYLTFPG